MYHKVFLLAHAVAWMDWIDDRCRLNILVDPSLIKFIHLVK